MIPEPLDRNKFSTHPFLPFRLIGIGVFLWLSISGLSYIYRTMIKDLLLLAGVDFSLTYWLIFVLNTVFLILSLTVLINMCSKDLFVAKKSTVFLYKKFVLIYVAIQVIQFFFAWFWTGYMAQNNMTIYVSYLKEISAIHYNTSLHQGFFDIVLLVYAGFFLAQKKHPEIANEL